MLKPICAVVFLGLSFTASAESVVLRCTFISGTYAGQTGYIGYSEEQRIVMMGGSIPAYFTQHSIEWSANNGDKFKLDRVTGDLYNRSRHAPFNLIGNCIASQAEARF